MTIDELKMKFVGKTSAPEVLEVERGSSKRYAIAVDEQNPYYIDDEFARCSRYGAVIAPPGFFGWPVKQPSPMIPEIAQEVIDALKEAGFSNLLDGECEFQFVLPIRSGDLLTCQRTVTDIYSRPGSSGREMVFCTLTSRFLNQNGDLVTVLRHTSVALPPALGA